jgi:hypothetical protein
LIRAHLNVKLDDAKEAAIEAAPSETNTIKEIFIEVELKWNAFDLSKQQQAVNIFEVMLDTLNTAIDVGKVSKHLLYLWVVSIFTATNVNFRVR